MIYEQLRLYRGPIGELREENEELRRTEYDARVNKGDPKKYWFQCDCGSKEKPYNPHLVRRIDVTVILVAETASLRLPAYGA